MTHTITTPTELDALPEADVLLCASGRYPTGGGTFTDCWVRPVPPWITGGAGKRMWEVLTYDAEWPQALVRTGDITSATVLYHPGA